ncbi:hypothetical protein BBP40_000160 [Aspergillus hancockii]|nr:hypothetical protein BBP40_000160 [Aspergillus hancockii]
MAVADYKGFLAENVLSERRTVTYRSLSRALRVHSTLAKQMLYDFHRNENGKRPQSVNATYLVTGVQKAPTPAAANGHANGDANNGDEFPPSSPYFSSSMPNQDDISDNITTASVLLVREEDLEDAKSTFQSISSIYIYSLQPTVLQDLNVLTDVSREMVSNHANEDPLEYGKQWGMIQNNNVKRRTGTRPPVPAAASITTAPKPTIPSKRPSEESSQEKPALKKEETAASGQSSTRSTPSTKPAEKTAPIKREKSNLFNSFAKAKPKQKKEEPATPAESAEPSGAEDVFLDDAFDDEPEELFPDSGKPASSAAAPRQTRKERQEKLKQMMEDDDEDEEMPDATEPVEESKPIDQPPPKQQELKEEMKVQGGRRRGKRQVMKKKVVKDSEGYLVTVEEPTWESFSEDEPAPPPKKKPAVSAPKGKPTGKGGQGNIMSFFGKK